MPLNSGALTLGHRLPYPADMQPRLMTDYRPPTGPLRIVHQDEDLVVVDKPSGLLSVPGKPADHKDCLENRVQEAFPHALLIHRLDLETSGLMIFALNPRAQRIINRQFEKRIVQKAYEARVSGRVTADTGAIHRPLTVDWPLRPMQKVCFETGKPSSTLWEVMDRETAATRLCLRPRTGRSHQLRVHCLSIGHPILGDPFYAPEADYRAVDRLQLHAVALALRHPKDGEWVEWTAPIPF